MKANSSEWWKAGVRFECQGSGKCCTSHGEYGFVYLTIEDRQRMAAQKGLAVPEFTRIFCEQTDGLWHLKETPGQPDCLFLKDKKCTVYETRPMQCRTWPFWPEVMNAKSWAKDVVSFCPGVGQGRLWTAGEIEEELKKQKIWDKKLVNKK